MKPSLILSALAVSALSIGWLIHVPLAVGDFPRHNAPRSLADKKKDKAVEEMMEKVHEGKRSPWKQAQSATAANPPDWNGLAAHLPKLEKMSELMKASKVSDISDSADSYSEAVAALVKSTKAKDAEGARKAISSLGKSCADCHYKGGVGGELDDD